MVSSQGIQDWHLLKRWVISQGHRPPRTATREGVLHFSVATTSSLLIQMQATCHKHCWGKMEGCGKAATWRASSPLTVRNMHSCLSTQLYNAPHCSSGYHGKHAGGVQDCTVLEAAEAIAPPLGKLAILPKLWRSRWRLGLCQGLMRDLKGW